MPTKAYLFFFGGFFLFFAQVGNAVMEESDVTSDEKGTLTFEEPQRKNPLALTYYGIFQGPAMSRPLDGGMINTNTGKYDVTQSQNLYNQFKLDYDISKNVWIGPVVNFVFQPGYGGQAVAMQDSGVRVGHRALIKTDDFSLLADLRMMAPLTPSRIANDEIFSIQSLQYATYEVPGTRWTISLCGFDTLMAYGPNIPARVPTNPNDPNDLNVYLAAYIYYHFTPRFAAVSYLEAYPYHQVGAPWYKFQFYPSDISPGISWNITPDISVTPLIMFYPGNLRADTIGSVAYISAKLL